MYARCVALRIAGQVMASVALGSQSQTGEQLPTCPLTRKYEPSASSGPMSSPRGEPMMGLSVWPVGHSSMAVAVVVATHVRASLGVDATDSSITSSQVGLAVVLHKCNAV